MRSLGRNGSAASARSERNSSMAYRNFGSRDRKKNLDSRERDRGKNWPLVADTGSRGRRDSSLGSRTDADRLWRGNYGSARHGELRSKKPESGSKEQIIPKENVSGGGIIRPSSFKKEFPALAAVQRKGVLDTGRTSATVKSPPSSTLGDDSWTSALAEAPPVEQTTPSCQVSLGRSNSNGLNMAEALMRPAPQIQIASQVIL